ncbi:hypothetical protein [Fonticella tunisiensis]|uniref:Uncharacterized protein n=1 Tax=Fonticella tunisiensis TaxID=1096341 RepID=A0A4V3EUS3_9CLOT|nr:hypothetical protein [Fonticella tunisiensis]TDT61077.1 hypothetical protein EDD71_10992 [Fonticella tunisiensis]
MKRETLEMVKKSQRLYFLALKFENRLPKAVVEYSKKICNDYTKIAKEMNLCCDVEGLIDKILK